jgi:hypothetical protein
VEPNIKQEGGVGQVKPLPPQEELLRLFTYDHNTGELRWRVSLSHRSKVGTIAGGHGGVVDKRITVSINGHAHRLHRIVYKFFTGVEPLEVDHIDGNVLNNRIENLRSATRSENAANSKKHRGGTSLYKGVSRFRGKWQATICKNGRQIHLGHYRSAELASAVYHEAAKLIHGEFATNRGESNV